MRQSTGFRVQGLVMILLTFVAVFSFFALPVEAVESCQNRGGAPIASAGAFLYSGCGNDRVNGEVVTCYPSLTGIVQFLLSAYTLILGIVGSLALLMFVWGGFQWLTSTGTEKRITAGMTTLKNAVIGLLIVFSAWLGVNFIVSTLTGGTGSLFTSASNQWWQIHKGALCYRALTAAELAKALAPSAKAPTPPPPPTVPSGTACRGTTPNLSSCRSDCECISGNCYQGFCAGGGLNVSQVMGGCCAVRVDGGKLSRKKKLESCKQFLQQEFQATSPRIKNTPAYWCPFPTNRIGVTEDEVCWDKPLESGNYTISAECETVKEPISL